MSAGFRTPGPWALIQFGGPQIGNSETKEAVCTMWGDGGTMKANACLIAAAPELLAALQSLTAVAAKSIYPKPDVGPDHPYAILRRAEAAIARAEGRS